MREMELVNDCLKTMLELVFEHVGLDLHPENLDEYKELLHEIIAELGADLNPGVARLIRFMKLISRPMAVATNGSRRDWETFSKFVRGLDPTVFDHVICGAEDPEVIRNKPSPDIYLACIKKFKEPPKSLDKVVIFEDSLLGITGAVASGMKTVLVNNNRGTHFDDIKDKINVIVDSFEDFKPESVGLPPYPPY